MNPLGILVGLWAVCFAVVVVGFVWADRQAARARRFDRHTDQALAVTRHPSRQVPLEDSREWAERWGYTR